MKASSRHLAAWLWQEWIWPLAICGAIVLPFKSAVADWEYVPTGSMMPTIVPVEVVLVNKLAYDLKIPFTTRAVAVWGNPRRGDIVVFFSPADGMRLVKRVVGLPGDVISMDRERLSINGVPLDYTPERAEGLLKLAGGGPGQETFLARENLGGRPHDIMILPRRPALRSFGPVTVPAGCYFVMGDNRDNSNDSRFIGCIPRNRIVGRASALLLSLDPARWGAPRFGRFPRKLE